MGVFVCAREAAARIGSYCDDITEGYGSGEGKESVETGKERWLLGRKGGSGLLLTGSVGVVTIRISRLVIKAS